MKKIKAEAVFLYQGEKYIMSGVSIAGAENAEKKLNALLQEAYEKGRKDEQSEPWRDSPFDDEDKAPLIDVPEGSDDPDYGPEKIPPREEKK